MRAPKLPERGKGADGRKKTWHKLTREWWKEVWASPMAGEFLKADHHGLFMLGDLVDAYWWTGDSSLLSEIRLQRQCFGLTPIDRRRLQWEVDRGDRAEAATKRRKAAPPRKRPKVDPRKVLEASGRFAK